MRYDTWKDRKYHTKVFVQRFFVASRTRTRSKPFRGRAILYHPSKILGMLLVHILHRMQVWPPGVKYICLVVSDFNLCGRPPL